MASNLALLEATDWAKTPLGPRERWPADMQAVVRMAMGSGFPVCTVWGPDAIQIYNTAYNAIYGEKHPHAFGRPARESWPEIWEFLGPALRGVRDTRSDLNSRDTLLRLNKHGAPEECYFDFSYSPVADAGGNVLGVVSIAVEKTGEVVFRRRQQSADLPLDSMDEDGLAGLAAALQHQLAPNRMDAAAAAFCPVDSRTELALPPLWSDAMAPAALPALAQLTAHVSGVEQHPVPPGLCAAGEAGPHLAAIALRGGGGRLLAMLYLVPHPLVPPESHLAFARLLCDRLHRIVHHAEQLGRVRRDLADQDALYRYLFDNVMDPVLYGCTEGSLASAEVVLAANASACGLLGYAPGELVGLRREALFFPGDAALAGALETRERERAFDGELTFRRKDGSPVPVEVRSRLVRGADGEVRSVTILRDLSRQLQREADRASRARFEAIAQLTGGVAHDFNNLLTVVLGSLELLQEELPADGRAYQYAANALLCAERGARLTSQLLSYSRQQPLRLQALDLNAHIEEMVGLLRSSLGETTGLRLMRGPALPPCRTDASQLTTALLNLAVNARDAMPGGGTVTVETGLAQTHGFLALRVRDTGEGIPAHLQGRVFEPYFTTKPDGAGSGLGLATVQGFARQCGGDVRVESVPGAGAMFELTLPIASEPTASPELRSPAIDARGRCILVVEDNDLVRAQVCHTLAESGFRVIQAPSGREALGMLAGSPTPDFLLTDQVMPGGWSGLQLAHEARRLRPGLPVLIMTGHDPWTTPEGEVAPFEILPKPFDRRTLLEAIERQW
jgi:PAS domain S-box-containing protein